MSADIVACFGHDFCIKIAAVRIVRDMKNKPAAARPLALTVGNFDGMHRGHRALAGLAISRARRDNWTAAALTFEPHPLAALSGKPVRRLGGVREKILHFARLNFDIAHLLRFNRQTASIPAADFADFLFDRLGARYLAVGENFRFGRGREGDAAMLEKCGRRFGAEVAVLPLQTENGTPISSGRVRESLREGDFAAAENLLGRPWRMGGKVIHGRGLGRQLGFATANLRPGFIPVCEGIFAAAAAADGRVFPAAVSIGCNPTVSEETTLRVEAHLLDFGGDNLYGRRVSLQLVRKLREEKKYESQAALRQAVAADIAQTREHISADILAALKAEGGEFCEGKN